MPRLTISEFSRRAGLVTREEPGIQRLVERRKDTGARVLARIIFDLLAKYDHLYGEDWSLGHMLREIEKERAE